MPFNSHFSSVHSTTIVGNTADLTIVQMTIIGTLDEEGNPQVTAEKAGSSDEKFYISFGNQDPEVWKKSGEVQNPR